MKRILLSFLLSPYCFAQETISMTALIANPEAFNGKEVQLIGVSNLEFEGNVICDSKEHLKYAVTNNCVWLSLEESKLKDSYESLKKHNGKYVIVRGKVNSKMHGHMGLNSASLEQISRFDSWSEE